jgi:hypothetical protein
MGIKKKERQKWVRPEYLLRHLILHIQWKSMKEELEAKNRKETKLHKTEQPYLFSSV